MRIALVWLGAMLVLGCKDKPNNQPITPPRPGSGSQTVTADAAGSRSPTAASEIVLPRRSGTPPVKTTTPFTPERADVLAKLDFAGFKKDVRRKDEVGLDIRYKTETRPKIAVTLTVQACFKCDPMELDQWQKHKDALRNLLAAELRDLPDTVFELGKTALAGAPVIYQYQVGYLNGADPSGAQVQAYSNAYALYYNDRTTMIRVVAEYKDDPPATREDMLRLVPRADLEKIALAFFDAYTHAW